MSTCTVLSDSMVREILLTIPNDKIIKFLKELEKAIQSFSNASERALQPNSAVVRRSDGRKTLFRPFTSDTGPGVKIIVDPTQTSSQSQGQTDGLKSNTKSKPTLHGILALCDEDGLPIGLVNAEEITAFRTALSVMIPYVWRTSTKHIVVFGAGKVALWHIRLVLRLRGAEIKAITIVNRSTERSRSIVDQLQQEDPAQWGYVGGLDILDPAQSDFDTSLARALKFADILFCTTPSKAPLFPASHLAGRQDLFISGIGSWTADMVEIDPVIFARATTPVDSSSNQSRGLVIADDREGVLRDSGEVVQSKLRPEQITELGELLALRANEPGKFSELSSQYLHNGLVIYKSIGVSVTDLAAGKYLLSLAKEQNIGISVPDF